MNRNGLLAIVVVGVLAFGVAIGFVASSAIEGDSETERVAAPLAAPPPLGFAGEFGSPSAPQPIVSNVAFSHYDIQIHSRDMNGTMEPVEAEHGPDCSGPPMVHYLPGTARGNSVFVCSDHVMTVLHEGGYGAIAITPTQQLTGTSATVTWSMSTESQSDRDWVDVWVTPWADNLTLPADIGAVDLQGTPRNAIQLRLAMDGNHAWCVNTYNNGSLTTYLGCQSGTVPNIHTGITSGTNEAAARQQYKLTITPSTLRFERLSSSFATPVVYFDGPAAVPNINGGVVQFMQHSYNPEKDGSCATFLAANPGRLCGPTWHWSNMACTPCQPFTLIRPNITEIYKIGRDPTGATITFPSAPAGAMLRFTALGGITVNGVLAPKAANTNGAFLASPYFLPLAQGSTSVALAFAPDGSYDLGFGMGIQDIAIWAPGGSQPVPTPTPVVPPTATAVAPTSTPPPNATPTPVVPPTVTPVTPPSPTLVVPPTSTPTPLPPTATPSGPRRTCTLRWGSTTIESYGNLTQAECANRGQ